MSGCEYKIWMMLCWRSRTTGTIHASMHHPSIFIENFNTTNVVWCVKSRHFNDCIDWNLLCTVRLISKLTVPAALAAVQVYLPASLGWMKAICRDPEPRTLRRTVSLSTRPSLCHVTEGGGEPSAWHRSVTEASTGAKYSRVSELITGGTSGARRNVWG